MTEKKLWNLSKAEIEREFYMAKLKRELDELTNIEEARDEGWKEGWAKGWKKGLAKARQKDGQKARQKH